MGVKISKSEEQQRTRDAIMREKLQNLSKEQLNLFDIYCRDNMRLLRGVCYAIWGKDSLEGKYYDDLYDDGMNVFIESVLDYNPNKDAQFLTFLSGNIKRSYLQWRRDNFERAKRCHLLLDKNGRIVKEVDDNGRERPVVVQDESFDVQRDDKNSLEETIPSNFDLHTETFQMENENIRTYIESLSLLQRKILKLMVDGYKKNDITAVLHISERIYNANVQIIQSYEKTKVLM